VEAVAVKTDKVRVVLLATAVAVVLFFKDGCQCLILAQSARVVAQALKVETQFMVKQFSAAGLLETQLAF
jgi:hypothetical protein